MLAVHSFETLASSLKEIGVHEHMSGQYSSMVRRQLIVIVGVLWQTIVLTDAIEFWEEPKNCSALVDSSEIASCYLEEELASFKDVLEHVEHVRLHLNKIKRYQDEVLEILLEMSSKKEYLGNALNSFSLLKRTHKGWLSLVRLVQSLPGDVNPTRRSVFNNKWFNFYHRAEAYLVQFANLTAAFRGLSRLQNVYHLTADTLANARLEGALPHTIMTAEDCFDLARYYFKKEFNYLLSIQWLNVALKKMESTDKTSICERDVLELYYFATCYQGMMLESLQAFEKLNIGSMFFTPSNWLAEEYNLILKYGCGIVGSVTSEQRRLEWKRQNDEEERKTKERAELLKQFEDKDVFEGSEELDEDDPKHLELCNYPAVNTETKKELRCRYVHFNKPGLRIGPFKMEEFHLDPPVLMYHQVISDQEIEQMIEFTTPYMQVAEVTSDDLEDELDETSRTSYQAWVEDWEQPLARRLSKRSAMFSGWDLYMSEPNQVASYGLAGEFTPHIDALPTTDTDYADYSVIMYYLNNVDRGGHTIFPALNVSVMPVKGSAVLWFNRRPDGAPDEKSLHGGCPVLQGTKWVMNKWFHVRRQHFPKCDKRENSSFKYFYI